MKNKKRSREAFKAPSYWQSYSDMMAALLLIFILIIAITLGIYKQKQADLETTPATAEQYTAGSGYVGRRIKKLYG